MGGKCALLWLVERKTTPDWFLARGVIGVLNNLNFSPVCLPQLITCLSRPAVKIQTDQALCPFSTMDSAGSAAVSKRWFNRWLHWRRRQRQRRRRRQECGEEWKRTIYVCKGVHWCFLDNLDKCFFSTFLPTRSVSNNSTVNVGVPLDLDIDEWLLLKKGKEKKKEETNTRWSLVWSRYIAVPWCLHKKPSIYKDAGGKCLETEMTRFVKRRSNSCQISVPGGKCRTKTAWILSTISETSPGHATRIQVQICV